MNLVARVREFFRKRRIRRLVNAITNGNVRKIETIVKKSPELANVKDECGLTPLHWAAMSHSKEMTEFLLKNNASTEPLDNLFGATPLVLAVARRLESQMEALLDYGADPNARDRNGRTPMQHAKEVGQTAMIDMLRKHGAKE
jgi:ankyrin repeat protein